MTAMTDRTGLREWRISRGANEWAEGSALVEAGRTRVLVTASVMHDVPSFLTGTGGGWVTAEYDMLPRSTKDRRPREARRGRPDGRSLEISRLIGRAARAAVETGYLGERTIALDCDVIQADGGTRTAAINGASVALYEALVWMRRKNLIPGVPAKGLVGAVSVGMLHGQPVLDLAYEQDKNAEVDMNVVMTSAGEFVEVQGTGEKSTFTEAELAELLKLARGGIERIFELQRSALGPELLREAGL
jgi:ribonuclease PH